MKTSKNMTQVIVRLCQLHGLDLSKVGNSIQLENEPYLPLFIEVVGKYEVSVAHYYTQNGDAMPDPEITFFTRYGDPDCAITVGDWGWIPVSIRQSLFVGRERVCTVLNEAGDGVKSFRPNLQGEVADFADMWATNLKQQGWLSNALLIKQA